MPVPPIPLPDPELRDDVVRLRAPHPADVDAIHAACQDPLIQRYTFVPVPYERAHAQAWVDSAAALRAAGDSLSLVVTRAGHDELVGTIGLLRPDFAHRVAEIGYWTAPAERGQGLTARAVRLLSRWALSAGGFARVTCDVDTGNPASQRVAEKAGFVREGVLRSAIEAKGRRWSLVVHSLIAEDLG